MISLRGELARDKLLLYFMESTYHAIDCRCPHVIARGRSWGLGLLLAGASFASACGADPRFGVMTHFAQGWDPALAQTISTGDVLRVRDELYWNAVETQKGVFKFPVEYDRYLAALDAQAISPLIVLSFENPNYDGGLTPYTPAGFAAYARYAVEVLRHCGTKVKAVEIWNEYNGTFNHGPASADRTGTYMKMLKVVYAAIKAERPDVTVIAGGTAGIPTPYWDKLFKGGVLNYSDAISVHPYRYTDRPEGIENEINDLRTLMQRYGTAKPIWVTEIGWQLKGSKAPGDFAIDEDVQARFLVRCYALLLSAGVQDIYWYLFRDDQEFTMGLLRNDAARTPKTAYRVLSTLSRQLQGATFVKRDSTPDDLYSMQFRTASGVEKRIIWSTGSRVVSMRGAISATDYLGRSLPVTGSIAMAYNPVYVTGPLRTLPPAPAAPPILADSVRDFRLGNDQAWSYGYFLPATTAFLPLTQLDVTDWESHWTGIFQYIAISPVAQHPSTSGVLPVSAVRRWTSPVAGRVRIVGTFKGNTEGDGVGVSVLVNGQLRFRKLLNTINGVVNDFDLTETLQVGSPVDFAVDPGPGAQINFDNTSVSVVIRPQP